MVGLSLYSSQGTERCRESTETLIKVGSLLGRLVSFKEGTKSSRQATPASFVLAPGLYLLTLAFLYPLSN